MKSLKISLKKNLHLQNLSQKSKSKKTSLKIPSQNLKAQALKNQSSSLDPRTNLIPNITSLKSSMKTFTNINLKIPNQAQANHLKESKKLLVCKDNLEEKSIINFWKKINQTSKMQKSSLFSVTTLHSNYSRKKKTQYSNCKRKKNSKSTANSPPRKSHLQKKTSSSTSSLTKSTAKSETSTRKGSFSPAGSN